MITQHAFEIILWRSLATFLLVGALVGVAVSLLMIFRPALFERINHIANLWISTRRMKKSLDMSICLEHWFYRHHRPLGMLVCVGAVYVFAYFGMQFDKAHALPHLAAHLSFRWPIQLLEALLDALVLAALTGAAVSLFVGLLLWQLPSLLRGLDETANRWVSMRRSTRFLEIPRNHVDKFVIRHDHRAGWMLLLGSFYLLFLVFPLLT